MVSIVFILSTTVCLVISLNPDLSILEQSVLIFTCLLAVSIGLIIFIHLQKVTLGSFFDEVVRLCALVSLDIVLIVVGVQVLLDVVCVLLEVVFVVEDLAVASNKRACFEDLGADSFLRSHVLQLI